jgi:hypothetical protein
MDAPVPMVAILAVTFDEILLIPIFCSGSGTGAWYSRVPLYRWSLVSLEPAKLDISFEFFAHAFAHQHNLENE